MSTPDFKTWYQKFRLEHPETLVHFLYPIPDKVIWNHSYEKLLSCESLQDAMPYIEKILNKKPSSYTRYGCIVSFVNNGIPYIGWSCVNPKDVNKGFKYNKYLSFLKATHRIDKIKDVGELTRENPEEVIFEAIDNGVPKEIIRQYVNLYFQASRKYYGKHKSKN